MKENKLIIEGISEKGIEVLKAKYKGLRLMKLAFKTAGVKVSSVDAEEVYSIVFSSKKRKIDKNQMGIIIQDFKVSKCVEGKDYKIKVEK